ncbi:hypothetical protein IO90_08680 [Chryseobacterium sp. FH1]|nr:hypothetical protein IO90_08680 [Chryseobacterium sp. FH1]
MRQLSRDKVPFNISFCSLNESDGISEGLKSETKVILMQGYRRNQSEKHEVLISFLRTESNERRQFYLPLLMEFNGIKIKNDR